MFDICKRAGKSLGFLQSKKELTRNNSRKTFIIVAKDGEGDTDTLADALKMLEGGGTIYIRAGTYTIKEQITIPSDDIEIYGDGNSTCLSFTNTTVPVYNIVLQNKNRCFFHDFQIKSATTGMAIVIDNADRIKVERISIVDINNGIFIYMSDCTNCIIVNNLCYDADRGILLYDDNSRNIISNNSIDFNYTYGIQLETNNDNNTITGNVFTGQNIGSLASKGIYINGATNNDNCIAGNVIKDFVTQIDNTGT